MMNERELERFLTLYQVNMDLVQKLENMCYPQADKLIEKALDNLIILVDNLKV